MIVASVILCFNAVAGLPTGDEDEQEKSSVVQVGGLLFDMDEGVKIEQGGGGSVYVQSNREYMQNKFRDIEMKFEEIDDRLTKIEKKLAIEEIPLDEESAKEQTPEPAGGRVLTS